MAQVSSSPTLLQLALALALASALLPACRCDDGVPSPAASASAVTAGPAVDLAQLKHDFGAVDEGAELRHKFTLTNRGGALLQISRIKTSNSSVTARPLKFDIAPGKSADVEVRFVTRGRSGPQRHTIQLLSNAPGSPHTLEISAQVAAVLEFTPPRVRLSTRHGKPQQSQIWLSGKLAAQAKLEIVEVQGGETPGQPPVSVELAEREHEGRQQSGLTFKTAATSLGYGRGTVQLKTGVAKRPSLTVRFTWRVAGNLTGIPKVLRFDRKKDKIRPRMVLIKSTRAGFKVTSARISEGPFTAEIVPGKKPGEVQVKVIVKPEVLKRAPREIPGKLVIVSNDPLEPKQTVELLIPGRTKLGTAPLLPHQIPAGPAPRPKRPRP